MAKCKFQKGDKVWSPFYGEGVVDFIDADSIVYPVYVSFNEQTKVTYTVKGKECENHYGPSLFYAGSYIVEAPEPKRRYIPNVGDLVAVANFSTNEFFPKWYARTFAGMDADGNYLTVDAESDFPCRRKWPLCESIHKHFHIPAKEEDV